MPPFLHEIVASLVNIGSVFVGGKNEKSPLHGSKSIWQFDPENETWAHQKFWPEMEFEHYYHGCAKAVVNKIPG